MQRKSSPSSLSAASYRDSGYRGAHRSRNAALWRRACTRFTGIRHFWTEKKCARERSDAAIPRIFIMRAAQFRRFGGPDVLEIVELPEPHAGAGEVRVRVRAAGVNASDWKKRSGQMDQELPQTLGYEAAGVVDEVGEGVTGVRAGDRVAGIGGDGAAQAEFAVLSTWAPIPASLDYVGAAALPSTVETAARALDQLGVTEGSVVLVNGASGSIGSAAVQFATHRGARVIGTGSPATHDYLRSLGAEPVAYGEGMAQRVRAIVPHGVGLALDVAGSGALPELIDLSGGAENVLTIADVAGAQEYGVRFSRGDSGRAEYAIAWAMQLVDEGTFRLPVGKTFSLENVAEAHRAGESGTVRGKLVLTLD
jgi:NADPH:quinone reductase-like Zn-dependent oxidoreductase